MLQNNLAGTHSTTKNATTLPQPSTKISVLTSQLDSKFPISYSVAQISTTLCMSAPLQDLVSSRHSMPAPRSGDARRRTDEIWLRLDYNLGLVDPDDLVTFREFIQQDINYLLVLMQDLEKDHFFRWVTPRNVDSRHLLRDNSFCR